MSPERSVRQLVCVLGGLLSYSPVKVKISAYPHTIATVNRIANRSNMALLDFITWGRYCNESAIKKD